MSGRSLMSMVLAAVAACLFLGAKPHSYYQLEVRSQQLTEALVAGSSLEVYKLFISGFREEHRLARFDSALADWSRGRTISRARSRVIDVHGLGGNVSTWIGFEGESDYSYVYQSWLHTRDGWQLLWLSRILDQSFQFGRSDTADLDAITEAALGYVASEPGLRRIHRRIGPPEVIVVVQPGRNGAGVTEVEGRAALWLSPEEVNDDDAMPDVPFYFSFALVRDLGDLATAAVDLVPTDRRNPGVLGRRRGLQVYLERQDGQWLFHSVGKIW